VSRIVQPSIDEFELVGNVVTHLPTQARWTAYEGSRTPHYVHRGSLGKVPPNGDEYTFNLRGCRTVKGRARKCES
jgi:hypothetical protein